MLDYSEANSAEPNPADADEIKADAGNGSAKRLSHDRSAIHFPYTHLEDALVIAQAVSEGGNSLSRDQIAGLLKVMPSSGGFALKISAARTFRLIEAVDGRFKLSDLGERMLSSDESEARKAKREAFLNIELYQKTFETYRNRNLPARPLALENAFVSFGVPPKQKDKARLAFERSAQFAGFFHAGKERLVEPIIVGPVSPNGRQTHEASVVLNRTEAPIENSRPTAEQQLLIKGLLERLPPPDATWSLNERARWLRALAVNLAIIYGAEDEGEIAITPPTKARALLEKIERQAPSKPLESSLGQASSGGDLDDEIPF